MSWYGIKLALGVSICLDVISIEISISTSSKSESRQSRKSRQRQKVSLDNRDISIEIETSRFRLDNKVQTKKSRSRSRNCRDLKFWAFLDSLSRSRPRSAWIFVFSRRDFSIRRDFRPRHVSTNLDNLDASRQSRQKSWRVTVSTEKSRF